MQKRSFHHQKSHLITPTCEKEANSREIARQKMADWFRRIDDIEELKTAYDRVQP